MASITVRDFSEHEKEQRKAVKSSWDKSLANNDTLYQNIADSTNELYNGYISDAEKEYNDKYRENSIQKLINERQVAENMANMGLTDSGINRTQQTAVQLSYANQKGALDRQKQTQVDALARELASKLAANEQERLTQENAINTSYEQTIAENATAARNAEIEAYNEWNIKQEELDNDYKIAKYKADSESNTEIAKEKIKYSAENSYVISANGGLLSKTYTGTLKDNGVDVYQNSDGDWVYIDNKSGKKTTLPAGQSPHTETYNKDIYTDGIYDESKVFKANGYQPNNINGVKLVQAVFKSGANKGKAAEYTVRGVDQKIWKANGKFYLWNKDINAYEELPESSCKNLT